MSNILPAMLSHLRITFLGVLAAVILGLPTAAFLIRHDKLRKMLFIIVDAIQTVPSLAMLTFVMLIFGLNDTTVIVAIFLYSLFPVLRNTYVGLASVDKGTIRAGKGIGMTDLQIFSMIRFPLAAPMILTGIRLSIVSALGLATTGVFIGAGGLGMLIWRGIQTRNMGMMMSGAVPVFLLAILFEYVIGLFEKQLNKRQRRSIS
ncbi:MAG: ABC transporter permease [Lachnospiraceae bacterium]|nr:ABC transporter permease [Lachnospiraceae bacterium]